MRSPADQRRSVARREKPIAARLLRAARRTGGVDAAVRLAFEYVRDHPDATPEDVMAALGPVVYGAVDGFVAGVWAELVDALPPAVEAQA